MTESFSTQFSQYISPNTLLWVLFAGLLVLFFVVSFFLVYHWRSYEMRSWTAWWSMAVYFTVSIILIIAIGILLLVGL